MITDKLINYCNNPDSSPKSNNLNQSIDSSDLTDSEIDDRLDNLLCNVNQKACTCQHNEPSRLHISYNQNSFCSLLDTGSQICLINQSTFNQLKSVDKTLTLTECSDKVSGIGNNKTQILGYVKLNLKIFSDDTNEFLPYAVINDDYMPYCCVFGENFISQNKISLDFNKQVVHKENNPEIFLSVNIISKESNKSYKVNSCFKTI